MPIQVKRCTQGLLGSLLFANGCNMMLIEDINFDFNIKNMTNCNTCNLLLEKHQHMVEADIIEHACNDDEVFELLLKWEMLHPRFL
jgi:hypothetical protein